jgi:hypothetical protein
MLVFSTQLCEIFAPLTFSLVHLPYPTPPSQSRSTVDTDSVWLGRGVEVLSCVGNHILQEIKTLTRFRIYKIARPPQTKNYEGRGSQTDNHVPQSPFTCQIF